MENKMPGPLAIFFEGENRRMTLLLAAMSTFCVSLFAFRWYLGGGRAFFFLNWNLFLAAIPWLVSSFVLHHPDMKRRGLFTVLLMVVWLLFFPNSPYILTDLFHLQSYNGIPKWFDLVLILSYAWTGLLFGLASLRDMETLLRERLGPRTVFAITTALLFIVAFGVYLGRYQRWNSWDVLYHPFGLANDIGSRVLHPFSHPSTWGMTLLMGVLLNFMHVSMKVLGRK